MVQELPEQAGIGMANWNWRVVCEYVSERFGISLSRSSCLNWLHRLGFAFKRPKKRLAKADEAKREAFVAEYSVLWEEARRSGARVFFADEAHFRADAELRGKWVLRGEPALVESTTADSRGRYRSASPGTSYTDGEAAEAGARNGTSTGSRRCGAGRTADRATT